MAVVAALLFSGAGMPEATVPVGVGLVRPALVPGQPLYFYGVSDLDDRPGALVPQDSLTFRQGAHYVDVATAPPWFVPEVLKLDYDLLVLRAKTLARHWVEVVVNQRTGETRWVDRHAVRLDLWPDALLNMAAVEVSDPQANPIRSGPDAATPVLRTTLALLQPLAVQGDWLRVGPSELADQQVPQGWVRWRDGDRLLITYSLLS